MSSLNGKTIIITGASRGIGREIALTCARDGANIVIAAKSDEPHPKLEGTIHSVAEEVREAGGQSLAVKIDVRSEEDIDRLIKETVDTFGGIDAIINNAGAIALAGVEMTPLKKFDLMMQVNFRAVFLLSQKALPHLKKSENGHILSLCPPLDLDRRWFRNHGPYTSDQIWHVDADYGNVRRIQTLRYCSECAVATYCNPYCCYVVWWRSVV